MANYAYRTILYRITDDVLGLDVTQNNADLSDYENTHQSSTVKVSDVHFAETTFIIDKTYAQIEALIQTPLAWTDVREKSSPQRYELYLVSAEPL